LFFVEFFEGMQLDFQALLDNRAGDIAMQLAGGASPETSSDM